LHCLSLSEVTYLHKSTNHHLGPIDITLKSNFLEVEVATFVRNNWFNIILSVVMLLTLTRNFTVVETTVSSVEKSVAEVKGIVDRLGATVSGMDKLQAVQGECINNIKIQVQELKERRNGISNISTRD